MAITDFSQPNSFATPNYAQASTDAVSSMVNGNAPSLNPTVPTPSTNTSSATPTSQSTPPSITPPSFSQQPKAATNTALQTNDDQTTDPTGQSNSQSFSSAPTQAQSASAAPTTPQATTLSPQAKSAVASGNSTPSPPPPPAAGTGPGGMLPSTGTQAGDVAINAGTNFITSQLIKAGLKEVGATEAVTAGLDSVFGAGAGAGMAAWGGAALAIIIPAIQGDLKGALSAAGGAAIGAAVGSIFPGVGTAIGAAAGAVIGSIAGAMFHGPTPNPTTTYWTAFGANGQVGDVHSAQNHMGKYNNAGDPLEKFSKFGLNNYVGTLADHYGIDMKGAGVGISQDVRAGKTGFMFVDPKTQTPEYFDFTPGDPKTMMNAMANVGNRIVKYAQDDGQTLKNYDPKLQTGTVNAAALASMADYSKWVASPGGTQPLAYYDKGLAQQGIQVDPKNPPSSYEEVKALDIRSNPNPDMAIPDNLKDYNGGRLTPEQVASVQAYLHPVGQGNRNTAGSNPGSSSAGGTGGEATGDAGPGADADGAGNGGDASGGPGGADGGAGDGAGGTAAKGGFMTRESLRLAEGGTVDEDKESSTVKHYFATKDAQTVEDYFKHRYAQSPKSRPDPGISANPGYTDTSKYPKADRDGNIIRENRFPDEYEHEMNSGFVRKPHSIPYPLEYAAGGAINNPNASDGTTGYDPSNDFTNNAPAVNENNAPQSYRADNMNELGFATGGFITTQFAEGGPAEKQDPTQEEIIQLEGRLAELKARAADRVPREDPTNVDWARTRSAGGPSNSAYPQAKNTAAIFRASGGPVGFASGGAPPERPVDALPDTSSAAGPVNGPGGPEDDAIDAKLSDGEYVIPAAAAMWIGIDKLNKLVAKALKDHEKEMMRVSHNQGKHPDDQIPVGGMEDIEQGGGAPASAMAPSGGPPPSAALPPTNPTQNPQGFSTPPQQMPQRQPPASMTGKLTQAFAHPPIT